MHLLKLCACYDESTLFHTPGRVHTVCAGVHIHCMCLSSVTWCYEGRGWLAALRYVFLYCLECPHHSCWECLSCRCMCIHAQVHVYMRMYMCIMYSTCTVYRVYIHVHVHVHYCYMTLIGMHELHGRMHPN